MEHLTNVLSDFVAHLPVLVFLTSLVRGAWLALDGLFSIWLPKTPERARFWSFYGKVLKTLDWLSFSWQRFPALPTKPRPPLNLTRSA